MRVAYFNSDQVNQHMAAQIASGHGAILCNLSPHHPVPEDLYDAVLYNLDDVPRDRHSSVIERLCCGEANQPAAVHGYGMTDEQAMTLRRYGVAAARQLHSGLFRILIDAVRRNRRVVPPDSKSTNLTWVNLAR